ncbi:MAG: hypothetical protein K2P63_00865 [Lachnospiraceae bacterium]|nr:hypothetical protein [Lachnospiraceae bacterium]
MKKMKRFGVVMVGVVVVIGALWLCFGEKIKILYTSLNSFKNENLAHTFQHTPEIQPTKKICRGGAPDPFLKEDNAALAESFTFEGTSYPSAEFMEDTKTSAMLVVKDDVIRYEEYFFGGDENTLFSSNSMGKSFVSALMGIAETHIRTGWSGNQSGIHYLQFCTGSAPGQRELYGNGN